MQSIGHSLPIRHQLRVSPRHQLFTDRGQVLHTARRGDRGWAGRRVLGLLLELSRLERCVDVTTGLAAGLRWLASHWCHPSGGQWWWVNRLLTSNRNLVEFSINYYFTLCNSSFFLMLNLFFLFQNNICLHFICKVFKTLTCLNKK